MCTREAFHLDVGGGSWRFALLTRPAGPVHAALLQLPAWAEEMNKCRRAVTRAAHEFAAAGIAVLQLDLLGTGDSPGEFEDAAWNGWLDDARAGRHWLSRTLPGVPVIGWGIRAGALLCTALDGELDGQLWWQPAAQGKQALQQFLRLRVAAEMDRPGESKVTMAQLKAALAEGGSVEVAGYQLPGALASGLEAAQLQAPRHPTLWLEATLQEPPALLPASRSLIDSWQAPMLEAMALPDRSPWSATELEDCPRLAAASTAWLRTHFCSKPS